MAGAVSNPSYVPERSDHLGTVAGVCREIGLREWLDAQHVRAHERVSVGAATVAMILNGLGFSNRRLYLVPQFFATKPVEHLLGWGITAEDPRDDCFGRALDWLYAHDPTTLFAGIALRACRRFGIGARQVHVDMASLSVSGAYAAEAPDEATMDGADGAAKGDLDARGVAITHGYSRDRRADLKQWMPALGGGAHPSRRAAGPGHARMPGPQYVAHPAADAPAPADSRPARADLRAMLRIESLTVRTVGNGKRFVCIDRA